MKKNNHYKMKNKPKKKFGFGKVVAYTMLPIAAASAGIAGGIAIEKNNVETPKASVSTQTNTDAQKIIELNKTIEEKAKQIADLNTRISVLEEDAETNATEIASLQSQVETKTTELTQAQADLQVLQQSYDQLESENAELEEQFSLANVSTEALIGLYSGEVSELAVPEGVSVIRPYAFAGLNLTSLSIPSTVTTIRSNAFNNLTISELKLNSEAENLKLEEAVFEGISTTNPIVIESTNTITFNRNFLNNAGDINVTISANKILSDAEDQSETSTPSGIVNLTLNSKTSIDPVNGGMSILNMDSSTISVTLNINSVSWSDSYTGYIMGNYNNMTINMNSMTYLPNGLLDAQISGTLKLTALETNNITITPMTFIEGYKTIKMLHLVGITAAGDESTTRNPFTLDASYENQYGVFYIDTIKALQFKIGSNMGDEFVDFGTPLSNVKNVLVTSTTDTSSASTISWLYSAKGYSFQTYVHDDVFEKYSTTLSANASKLHKLSEWETA